MNVNITALTAGMDQRRKRRSASGCRMKRLRKVGSRCFCGGKMAKTSRCR